MSRIQFPTSLVVLACVSIGAGAEPTEPFLRDLAPGVFLESSTEVPAARAEAIGNKLGGRIRRLTNSALRVHGCDIRVNAITAADEASAAAILGSLRRMKPDPYCFRNGLLVIEYVGKGIDEALARKTSYELGLETKPSRVRYRVTAELATVEQADYMACTPLFNQFLALQGDGAAQAAERIADLSGRFRFGRSLTLRRPELQAGGAEYGFRPESASSRASGAGVVHTFAELPEREGVPYVTATIDLVVDDTGFAPEETAPPAALTAATSFWPAEDPAVVALARKITAGKTSHEAKAAAILEWLTPGRNIRYRGETGSRWGTARVLEQAFGHCWDFSDVFVTLARAAGVPSRQVAGWVYGSTGHVWAEYYREGKGWQQVDPTGGGTLPCGIYHIPYFTSEDGEMPILYVAMPRIEVEPSP